MKATSSANRIFSASLVLVASVLLAGEDVLRGEAATSPAGGQQVRGDDLPAAWGDLDTWSRYLPSSDETEIGLGLKTAGAKTSMLIAFSARLKGSAPRSAPAEVLVHASAGVLTNARSERRRTLKFTLPSGSVAAAGQPVRASLTSPTIIDLTPRLGSDGDTPDARVNFATAAVTAADFVKIVRCGQPTATVLGVDVAFRPDQLQALREFANRIFLKVPQTQ